MKQKGIIGLMVMLILITNFNSINDLEMGQQSKKTVDTNKPHDQGSENRQSIQRICQDDFEIIIPWDLGHYRGQIIQSMITNHPTLGNKYNYIFTHIGLGELDSLKTRLSGGSYPNLIICSQDWYSDLAQFETWENFSNMIAGWSGTHPTWVNDITDGWWHLLDFEKGNGSGSNIVALPFFGQTVLPYVNTDHFKAAGLNHTHPEEDLENLAEWLAACDALNTVGYTPFAMVGDGSMDTTYMNYMLGSTDNYISSRYVGPVPATVYPFDTPPPSSVVGGGGVNGSLSVEGFATYLKMKGEGWVQAAVDTTSGGTANTLFGNGTTSMVFCGPWGPIIFDDTAKFAGINLNFTAVPMPACSDGVRSTIFSGGITMVPAGITNATRKTDAMTLAEWLLEDENQMKTVENSFNHIWRIPVRESLKSNPWFSAFPNRTSFVTHIESQNYGYAWGKQHPSWMAIHENVMEPGYYNALIAVTWNGSYTDQEYTNFAQTALDAMALEIETNYLPYINSTISIIGNGGFSGYPGSGTIGSPYLIKNARIISPSGNLIEIKSTSAYFTIANCTLNGMRTAGEGIYIDNAGNGTIVNNTIHRCGQGITLSSTFNTIIENNTVKNSTYTGINVDHSDNNTITKNRIYNSFQHSGVWLDHAKNNTLSENWVYNHHEDGIRLLVQSNDNHIINNTCYSNNWVGIRLQDSCENNVITNNTAYNNSFNGILIEGPTPSDNNLVQHNVVRNNVGNGIAMWQNSSSNTIFNNTIHNNVLDGIYVGESTNNSLMNNTISNNRYGILLWDSTKTTIEHNSLVNDGYYWGGSTVESYKQKTIGPNQVNGKPFVYWENQNGGTVPNGAGQIFLFNCTNVIITDQTLSNTSAAIRTAYSSHLTIKNNSLENNRWGIFIDKNTNHTTISNNTGRNNQGDMQLWEAYNNIVRNNTLGNNSNYGIVLDAAISNLVTNNTIFKTKISGIYLLRSENNTITQNIVFDNEQYGISAEDTSNENFIQFNDLIGNNAGGSQAADNGSDNVFEYNHWSEWTSPDVNADGIVDDPYSIEGNSNNQDQYPLVNLPSEHYILLPIITSPSSGEILSGDVTIAWTESKDTLGFSVKYNISYSTDAGVTWTQITADLTTTSASWDTRTVPDGVNYILKVEAASSGGLSTSYVSSVFIIDNILPTIIIDSPLTQTYTASTITVTLSGDAANYWYYIESVDSQNQTWTTSVDRTLTLGSYTLHAYGNDSTGNITHVSRTFTIEFVVPTTTTTTPSTTPPTTTVPTTTEPLPSTTTTQPATIEVGSGWNGYLLLIAFGTLLLLRKRRKRS